MRTYIHGLETTVTFNYRDAAYFSSRWPCSTVMGRGSFTFDSIGDLVDTSDTAIYGDGPDWLAFSQDCQRWGSDHLR